MALAMMRMIKPPGRIEGGKVIVGGTDLMSLSERDMRKARLNKIAYIPQGAMNSLNPAPQNNLDSGGAALTVVHDFGAAKLTSLSGFQAYGLSLTADITDGFISGALTGRSPFVFSTPNAFRQIGENLTQWTQELRLDGRMAGGTSWVGGVSGLWSSFASATSILSPALANGTYSATQSTANLAAFGEVTVPIVDRLRGFVGLRFTHELKNFNGVFGGNPGGGGFAGHQRNAQRAVGRGGFGAGQGHARAVQRSRPRSLRSMNSSISRTSCDSFAPCASCSRTSAIGLPDMYSAR